MVGLATRKLSAEAAKLSPEERSKAHLLGFYSMMQPAHLEHEADNEPEIFAEHVQEVGLNAILKAVYKKDTASMVLFKMQRG